MTSPEPRRRPSPAVYRRRRLVLLLIVLVIAAVIAVLIWQPWRSAAADGVDTKPSVAPSATTPAATPTESITPSTAPETAAPETAEATAVVDAPAPDPSATPAAPCSSADITVLAVTDKDSYGGDELPQLSISLTNDGEEACLMNVGTTTQEFTISSGSDTWWRSTDCQTEPADQVVQIEAGQTVTSVTPLAWDRTRSSVSTCADTNRAKAPAGYFNLAVSIGGISSHSLGQFVLR